jgi:maltose O-acetyltransferase
MSLRQFVGNQLIGILPPTRAYRAKRWILRQMKVDIADSARVVSSVRIWGDLQLSVGEEAFLGHELLISGGRARVSIGNCVDIGPRVTIVAGTHDVDMTGAHSAGTPRSRDVRIEDGVWIGAGTTILAGVTIGHKTVIAAGSTVTDDIPPYVVAAGAPCRVRKVWDVREQAWLRVEARAA